MERITITLKKEDLKKLDNIGKDRGTYTRSATIRLLINSYKKEITTTFITLTESQREEVKDIIKKTFEELL